MYSRAIRCTFTNEVMKKALLGFIIENFDLQYGMIMSFKLHVSENQVLHVGVFPDEETAENAAGKSKAVLEQIAEMGAKHEVIKGPLTNFMIAGDVTLDQLTSKNE